MAVETSNLTSKGERIKNCYQQQQHAGMEEKKKEEEKKTRAHTHTPRKQNCVRASASANMKCVQNFNKYMH